MVRRRAGAAVVAAAVVLWPFLMPPGKHFYGVLAVVYALMALSLLVLTGWTGQISLGHAAFLGVGVYVGQRLLAAGVPLVATLALVGLTGATLSLALAVPSLRLRGVYLTIVTLAFGAACERYIFSLRALRGIGAATVPRPSVFGFSTASDRNLYFVALVVLVGALVVVRNLRRSDMGRVLFAIRDSEDAAAALGVRVAPYKIAAFALSASLATMAGVFYAILFQATPAPSQFGVLQSFFLLALPVVGGMGNLAGVVIGGTLFATAQPIVNLFGVRLFLATGLLVSLVTLSRTDGIVGAVDRLVRSWKAASRPRVAVHYGSFVPGVARTGNGHGGTAGGEGHGRIRLSRPLPDGSRLQVRLSLPTDGTS